MSRDGYVAHNESSLGPPLPFGMLRAFRVFPGGSQDPSYESQRVAEHSHLTYLYGTQKPGESREEVCIAFRAYKLHSIGMYTREHGTEILILRRKD